MLVNNRLDLWKLHWLKANYAFSLSLSLNHIHYADEENPHFFIPLLEQSPINKTLEGEV